MNEWTTCPTCQHKVHLCQDGTLGRHYITRNRVQTVCPGGAQIARNSRDVFLVNAQASEK